MSAMTNLRVFTFSPHWGLPFAGPFAIKLLAWLELAGIPLNVASTTVWVFPWQAALVCIRHGTNGVKGSFPRGPARWQGNAKES